MLSGSKNLYCEGAQANVRKHPSGIMAIDSIRIGQGNKDSLAYLNTVSRYRTTLLYLLPIRYVFDIKFKHFITYSCWYGKVVFHPDINDARWWYVIQVFPRGKTIYQEQDVDPMVEVGVEDDAVTMEEEEAEAQDDGPIDAPTIVDHEEDNVHNQNNFTGDAELLDDDDIN